MVRTFNRQPLPGDAHDPFSLTTMLLRYLLWMETHHFAQTTIIVRRHELSPFIQWCLERDVTDARSVTRDMLERFQRHLFHYRKRDGDRLAVASQLHRLIALRRWFTWLTRERHILLNPTTEMVLPREEHRIPRHTLTQGEAEAVLAQPDISTMFGLRDRAILETFYSTGIRRSELATLELSDIDHDRRTVLIRLGKGRKDRVVPIGERALAWINKYLAEARPDLLRDTSQRVLFLTKAGRPLHGNHLSALVAGYVKSAGIAKGGGCHLFRHTTATLMHENGADIRHIQALLGHARLDTTQIYTRVSIKKLREVHEKTHPAGMKPMDSPDRTASNRDETKQPSQSSADKPSPDDDR